tara:strand:+ start:337 stop:1737 length:1401 start_codon:yes stop_codon:yes gene_type:complete
VKKKILFYFVLIISLFLLFGIFLINQNENNKVSKLIKDNTPSNIKYFLKNTVFYIPLKIREFKEIQKDNRELKDKNTKIILENNILKNKLYQGSYDVITKDEYLFQSFVVPFTSEKNPNFSKSKAYLEVFKDKIIIFFWSGKIIYFEKNNYEKEFFSFEEIKNNISQKNFFDNNIKWTGIRDALIVDNKIYLSLTEEIGKNCYMTSVIRADLNFNNLKFTNIFKPLECTDISKQVEYFRYFNGHQTGGRLIKFNNRIYLTIGDYNTWEYVQDDKSIIGKVIEINPDNGEYKIVTKGHRNQQGLAVFSEEEKILISSEHGPKGGDEINLIDLKENPETNNFGWPISSYGDHYDVVPINKFTKKYAPLNKSHEEYNFKEPIKYFNKAIAPSQIIRNNFSNQNQFILSTLGKKSLFFLEINDLNDVEIINIIDTGNRIRDIIYDQSSDSYFMYQEHSNMPKVVKISKMN